MRFLAVTDFHNTYDKVPEIIAKAGKVDGTLLAGDLTHFGPSEKAKDLLAMLPKPVFAVPGNCDKRDIIETLNSEGVCLHGLMKELDGVTIVGIGGSNPTPFNTPFELSEKDIKGILEPFSHKGTGCRILLSHAPPKGSQDEIPGGIHVGSEAVRDVSSGYAIVVCGHIHEARGVSKMGETIVVNPGCGSIGNAAVIDIDTKCNVNVRLI